MIVKWLVFSDLHFSYKNVNTETIRKKVLSTIQEKELNADFLLLGGDFFFQGNTEEKEIEKCENFIHNIASNCGCDKSAIYMTAGNHDLKRSERRENSLSFYTRMDYKNGKKREGEQEKELDEEGIKELGSKEGGDFEAYRELCKRVTGKPPKSDFTVENNNGYRILNINTSILAGSDYDEKHLSVYSQALRKKENEIENDDKINIAFMHHGVEYLREKEQRKFQQFIEDSYIDIVFSGHSHDIGIKTYDHTERGIRQFTCGGPLEDKYNKPSFYYCAYNSESHEITCYLYAYNSEAENWKLADSERTFKDGKRSWTISRFTKHEEKQSKAKYVKQTDKKETSPLLEQFGIKEALTLKEFVKVRNKLIQEAKGDIILAGQSLENAFDIREDNESIVSSIKHNRNLKNIDIFLTDPIMFDCSTEIELGDTPISRIESTMHTILHDIAKDLSEGQSVNIYFIPLVQLDHMVFVGDTLLLRHTLLWTNDSHYKATPLRCERVDSNEGLDGKIIKSSMYNVYKEYIERLKADSMEIEIQQYGNTATKESKAKLCHRAWRQRLYELRTSGNLKGTITMHKLYRKQLISDLHSTWDPRFRSFSSQINWGSEGEAEFFCGSRDKKIDKVEKLYCAENLLNDSTQKILLPYVKETERLLNGLVKRYDQYGEVHIFPSLDIGFPNNILRLAGGFATGMLIVWKCGTPIVPVDTTVNVCSSSYYEFDISALKGKKISEFFNKEIIHEIINKGSVQEGLAFSFNTGNHFILLCRSKMNGHYYLVLHSSAKQYKDSYLGLYPKPGNWYSDLIKTYKEKGSERYIHYLKDAEAERFINIARSLNEQNKDIHNWFAGEIFKEIRPIQKKTFHHYGMPTDYSIAIGTYVVDENDIVPIFSREGYPIFLFRPSSDMWSIKLEGKNKFVIPHGWGQELQYEYFKKKMTEEEFSNMSLKIEDRKLVFKSLLTGQIEERFKVEYPLRFDKKMVAVRNLYSKRPFDGTNIFGDTPYIRGVIEDVLYPVALFSNDTNGDVKYYFEYGDR